MSLDGHRHVGWRRCGALGNALSIATALATIVNLRKACGTSTLVILYEAASPAWASR